MEGVLNGIHMMEQIGQALFQRVQIFRVQLRLGCAAVVLQGPDGGHNHHGAGLQPCQTALDVQEFLRAKICAESGLGHGIVSQTQSHPGGGD